MTDAYLEIDGNAGDLKDSVTAGEAVDQGEDCVAAPARTCALCFVPCFTCAL